MPLSGVFPIEDWDFRTADTKEGTHVIHSYPAMMIPQVARRLIERLRHLHGQASTLLDPFCGAGTVLVEAARQGLEAWGNDLNPLALKIAQARTTPLDGDALAATRAFFDAVLTPLQLATFQGPIPEFQGRDFWFQPKVSYALAFIAHQVETGVPDDAVRNLARMAFSETVRLVSNTRRGEFKLYRLPPNKLQNWDPDVLEVFRATFARYATGVEAYRPSLQAAPVLPRIVAGDARLLARVPDAYFDLMVTSPPYGDSRTTVAYGQFSRLSLEWLGVSSAEARSVDRRLLGGQPSVSPASDRKAEAPLSSATLQAQLTAISRQDERRAQEVATFYRDLAAAIRSVTQKLRPGALCGWVVANRTVKQVVLPTDVIIAELSRPLGYTVIDRITRNIPNKRMPRANSPSNVPGKTGATMTQEHVVILRFDGA
ncbi:Modification methylase MvaI [Sulfobacillus acidophilus TPY]|uniref:site-specific DNA-methyltransferase (cytosine-N(4)-specific) n=1 Tax=Sulfobacillus acidophilus (strain ATCC 700253 / DSM 10332 / NAL) TaxID=679936 RepID=G8TSL1_SULAD|nr:Modification methylase MvaI [Sulfobacillus acidophilus TPY]AEW06703.1 D12 class N6 adenine-specific DNA methyltransferase [Sulfobacillus acidophilus DSM 10332]